MHELDSNELETQGLQASKLRSTSSRCLLRFFFSNHYPPLLSMLGNTICQCLKMKIKCLCKVLEP
ncbi:hypothetical protein OIU84_016655 [Salix udensis]|uniref:Uncharacterized protein n=1 Tax=Salix udensis TaxID=889485 RepID=A0AAD6JAA7_9ROSI|nr:hypothetical protein OIU84_016655 [Salix udensis]